MNIMRINLVEKAGRIRRGEEKKWRKKAGLQPSFFIKFTRVQFFATGSFLDFIDLIHPLELPTIESIKTPRGVSTS